MPDRPGDWADSEEDSDQEERELAEAIRLSLMSERLQEITLGEEPLEVLDNGMPPAGKLYNTFNDAMAAACSAPDAVGMWESDKGVHYVLRKGDVRKWGPGVPNSSVRRVWRLIQDSGEAKDKGDGRSPADAPSAPQADEVLPEPTSTLETPQVPAPAVSTPPFAAHLISGSGATHNQVKIESVLKAIENEGSALSADYIGRTMDEMYKSGKLQPKDYGMHAGKCLARFYNLTDFDVEVDPLGCTGQRGYDRGRCTGTLRVPAGGSVLKPPWRYTPNHIELEPGTECIIQVGDYPPCMYISNTDERQVIFVERQYLPEEIAFQTSVEQSPGMQNMERLVSEWKSKGGKQRRREATAGLQECRAFFQEQVRDLEAAVGAERARMNVDAMEQKLTKVTTELETGHDYTGIVNQGATCYMNSLLQALYMTPELRFALYRWEWSEERGEQKADSIPYQLQKLFCHMQLANVRAVETKALTVSFGWTAADAFQQHDVSELFNIFCDSLENNFRETRGAGVIASLFEGREKNYLRCLECGYESGREETFKSVMVPVKNFGEPYPIDTLEEGLHKYYTSERLSGDNQWHCERCKKKVDADKGLGLSKVPYILSINLGRFTFDWETGSAVKLDNRVEFPHTLDVAQFLASTDSSPAASEGGATADEPDGTNFGKDGAAVLMRGRSAVGMVVQDSLPYELYAILIHSGTVAAGHYYGYIRDFDKDQWFEFNDSTVLGPLTTAEVQRAYGGRTCNSYGYWVAEGTAYNLMYRRQEPEVNIRTVDDAHIPTAVVADIAREEEEARVAAEAEQASQERQREAIPFAVAHRDQMKVVWVKEMKTWGQALQQVREELDLEPAIENLRVIRLEPLQHLVENLRNSSGSRPALFDCDERTLVCDVPRLQGAVCQVEIKSPGAPWGAAPPMATTGTAHIHFTELNNQSLDITRHLTVDLGTPFATMAAQITEYLQVPENEVLRLHDKNNKRISGLALRTVSSTCRTLTPEWMTEALQAAVGEEAADTLVDLVSELEQEEYMYSGKVFFVNCTAHPIRIAQKQREYNYNLRQYLSVTRTLETLGGRATPDSAGTMFHTPAIKGDQFQLDCYSIGFEEVHISTSADMHQIVIITDNVRISDARTFLQCRTGPKPKVQTVATVTAGPRKLPVYRFHGMSDDLSEFLFEVEVEEKDMDDMGVLAFKEMVVAKMAETGIDAPPAAHLRLCELGGAVFQDGETLLQAFDGVFNGSEKIGLTVRDEPEDVAEGKRVLSAIRYHPESFTLAEEHYEFTIETSGYDVSAARIRTLIAEAMGPGGIPADRMAVACRETAGYGKQTGTANDMRLMEWNYRFSLRLSQDNCLFYFKDLDAEELELTESEKTERTKKVVLERQKRTRETDTRTSKASGRGEAQISIRGAGLQQPTSPGGTQQPAPEVQDEAPDPDLARSVSTELLTKLLSNPNLTEGQRAAITKLQEQKSSEEGELSQWLGRTTSRKELARQRKELQILQAIGPDPAGAHLVRTPSAAAAWDAAEIARLEQASTDEEIARLTAEVQRLRQELGL